MSRSLQSRTFTPPVVCSWGAFIQFPSAIQRCSVIRLTPSFFAASRDEQVFIVTDLRHTFSSPFYPLRLQPTKNAGLRRTGRAVTRQETTSFPNPSPNPIGRVLRLGPCCIQNRLYFHESSAHTSVSKLWEPLGLVAGLRRQVLHIRAHSARHRVRDLHFRTAPAY